MKKFKSLSESCFFKTGRDGVVVEFLDLLGPNLFDDNENIGNHIFKRYSCFRVTIIDGRKKEKGEALYYNLSPNEAMLLTHLISDGDKDVFFKRVGAFNKLGQLGQVKARDVVQTFGAINFDRFDNLIRNKFDQKGTSVTFQKNFCVEGDKLNVKKFTVSYEEGINSASKWKIAIEHGTAKKDSRGNGLNVIAPGSYAPISKAQVLLQFEEIIVPINEAGKRVILAEQSFYGAMKSSEIFFTERKENARDWKGENIDEWNPEGVRKVTSKVEGPKPEEKKIEEKKAEEQKTEAPKTQETPTQADEGTQNQCSECTENISENVIAFSKKKYGKKLCMNCQKEHDRLMDEAKKAAVDKTETKDNSCSGCGIEIPGNVKAFSEKRYGKALCLNCQRAHQ